MGTSLLDQLVQIDRSITYDDAVASANTVGVAEAQTSLEGDMNVLRTIQARAKSATKSWYEDPDMTVDGLAQKYVRASYQPAGLIDVSVAAAGTTNAFDTAIKTITDHSNGAGSSTAEGVIVNTTFAHKLVVRDHDTQNAINDGSGNEVYGRLSWSGTEYIVTWYSWVSGTETAYTFGSATDIDLIEVLVSRQWQNFPWDHPYHPSFHDTTGFTGAVDDDNVNVDGMTDLLTGLTTQAQVNAKVDDLGSTTVGQGAALLAIADASGYYTGTDIEAALNELEGQLGGDTSATFDFTTDGVVLADDDAVYSALDKLNEQWGDLFSTANGEGASLVGVEDANGYFTGTDVEAVLDELYLLAATATVEKETLDTGVGTDAPGTVFTIPNSNTYTLGSGANMDVYLNGQLLVEGAGNDYTETSITTITINNRVKPDSWITFIIRS